MRVLFVEDEFELQTNLKQHLVDAHYSIDVASDGEEGLFQGCEYDYDAAIIDVGLPKLDGIALITALRERGVDFPILILTARDSWQDKVKGLDCGADDYLTKPFDCSELEARCRAVIRRQGGAAENIKRFGNTVYDGVSGKLRVDDIPIRLRNRELRLLEIFINAPGQLFSKSKLVDRLFSYEDDVAENAIEVYVARLRKKLESSDLKIITERGMGYRLSLL